MRLRALALALSATLGLSLAAPAFASTGGTPDGEAHPNVAFLAFYSDGVRYRCSGTLVSESVVLTAGHCTDGVDGAVLVTFASVLAEEEPDESPLPKAADTEAGYTGSEAAPGYVAGEPHTHPGYSDFTDVRNWNDVGVVQLDDAVTEITPAEVASMGTLDRIKKNSLSKTLFTGVGYGTEVRKADDGRGKPTAMAYPLLRRFVEMPGQKLTAQILQTNGNPHDKRGTGGTCFGDSGGPIFLGEEIVGLTSYGNNDQCNGPSGNQRVDIDVVQQWLAEFPR